MNWQTRGLRKSFFFPYIGVIKKKKWICFKGVAYCACIREKNNLKLFSEKDKFPEDPMKYDTSVKYHTSHEWAKKTGDSIVFGISDYAQDSMGEVVFVELPPVGKKLKKDDPFGVVESVKAATDIYAPLSGEVVAVNETLIDSPGLVNIDPFGKGWFLKVKPDIPAEYDDLMTAADYEAYVKGR